MATSVITHTETDASGNAIDYVARFRLTTAAGQDSGFRLSNGNGIAAISTTSSVAGAISMSLENNANITPGGSFYVAELLLPSSNGGTQEAAIISSSSANPQSLYAALVSAIPTYAPPTTVPPTILSGANTFTGINQFGSNVYFGSGIPWIDPRYFGAVGDGATDDATSINNAVISVGGTTVLRQLYLFITRGAYKINSTVTFDRKTGRCVGGGAGSVNQLDGATLYWGGSAGSPMLLVKRTWSLVLEGLRFRGKSTAIPSAAIELRSTTGESPTNTNVVLRDIWVGSYGGFDGDNATQFDDGVIVDGDNLQGDQSVIDGLVVQGCENAGLRFDKTQNVLWDVRHFMPNACNYGIQLASKYIIGQDWFCSSNLIADICFSNDASLSVRNFGSEGSVKLATLLGSNAAMSLTLERGYWQVGTNSDTSATIDAQPSSVSFQQVILRDFNFTDSTGGAKHAIIRARKAKLYLELENVFFGSGTLSDVFDLSMTDAGESRHLVFKNVYIGSTCYNGEWKWFRGDTDPDISLGATGNPRYYRGVLDASGTGDPAGAHIADIGSTWHRTDGGANTSLYVKESGNGANTGWVGK